MKGQPRREVLVVGVAGRKEGKKEKVKGAAVEDGNGGCKV